MPNIASLLKAEILRLARKEIRNELESLKKALSHSRSEIAQLKRRTDQLEKLQARVSKQVLGRPAPPENDESTSRIRFSAKRFAAQRKKLGLSAADMGLLLGVSGQSIYHWEAEKSRPRQAQLAAIAALRKIGKREARSRLEQLGNQDASK
ncbi:helix-turn-helix domain-containing protein [Geothrix sp.]|jgi:DNA-binding transcriptional regulator YiaG|uniref:helix-turn-helix domain-containing protein n=1 Tax=Geothrix sp. TaxID=1962974 RepID=UPI0025BB5CEA|nr:helix-turn-helix domain-containing protein [Geothrix sp.]